MVRGEEMIVAGIGFCAGATSDDIVDLLRGAERQSGCEAQLLAVPDHKAGRPALIEALSVLGVPLIAIDRVRLERVQARCPTSSRAAMEAVGLKAIAEGCALAALDEQGQLVLPRIASARVTCALATGNRS
jgi:cobalamin biosynthesis protein CbiG